MANRAFNPSRSLEMGTTAPPAGRPQVDVVAITLGDDFLIDLGEVLSGQATVRPVDTVAAAIEQLWSSKRGQVLVVDTRDLADPRDDVELATKEAPHAVVVLFTNEGEEDQVADALQDLPITAVLPIPLDRRRTALTLEASISDAISRQPGDRRVKEPPPARPTERRPTQTPMSMATGMGDMGDMGMDEVEIGPEDQEEDYSFVLDNDPPAQRQEGGGLGAGAGAALWAGLGLAFIAASAGGYYFMRGHAPAASPQIALPAPDTTSVAPGQKLDASLARGTVDDLLEKARQAMQKKRYTDPEKDSALFYYRSAQAVDPTNAEANDGLQRVAQVLMARFEDAFGKGRWDEASAALASLKQALPGDGRLVGLEQRLADRQLARLVADGNYDAAEKLLQKEEAILTPEQLDKYKGELARRQDDSKLTRLAGLADAAIRDGRLVEPAEDNARADVLQMIQLAPKSPLTGRAVHDLTAAYLRRAREGKGGPETDRWLQEARNMGVPAADIEAARRDAGSSHQKADTDRLVAVFHDRLNNNRLTEPQDSAAVYLANLQAADPNEYASASRELSVKLMDRARAYVTQGKIALADADIKQAVRYGADPRDVAALQQLETAPVRTPGPSPAAAAISAAAAASAPAPARLNLTAASNAASGPASPATSSPSPATLEQATPIVGNVMPKKIRDSQVEVPQKALQQNLGGSVTVQFVIDGKGEPRDIHVVEESPPHIFDRATIAAVKRWRFQPTLGPDGKPQDITVTTAIRFAKPQP